MHSLCMVISLKFSNFCISSHHFFLDTHQIHFPYTSNMSWMKNNMRNTEKLGITQWLKSLKWWAISLKTTTLFVGSSMFFRWPRTSCKILRQPSWRFGDGHPYSPNGMQPEKHPICLVRNVNFLGTKQTNHHFPKISNGFLGCIVTSRSK